MRPRQFLTLRHPSAPGKATAARTLESKLGWPSSLAAHLEAELRTHFAEAWICGYESLTPQMTNDEKDRQVLAAAVHGQAPIIVTFKLRHFRPETWRRGVSARCTHSTEGWTSTLKLALEAKTTWRETPERPAGAI